MKTIIEVLEGSLPQDKLKILIPKLKKVYRKRVQATTAQSYLVSENKELGARVAKYKKDVDALRVDLEEERLKPLDFISAYEEDFSEDSEESSEESPEPKETQKETELIKEAEKIAE